MPQTFNEKLSLESNPITNPYVSPSLAGLRGERVDHFTHHPFPRLFEAQVAAGPEKLAVACENGKLTFGELNARANQLARHLRAEGVGREALVGICIDRSLDMAVGILGILKAGAAYLPLDPEYPSERLALILNDAQPAIVVTKSFLKSALPENEIGIVLLDQDWPAIAQESAANLTNGPLPDDLAYVIYTSGSTGEPKGVMITHGNLSNYLLALNHEVQINEDDLYLHIASIAFSSSRRQLMLPLTQGAAAVIATSDERKDPIALFEMIKHRRVTVMDGVPSFWRNCTTILASLDDRKRTQLLDNRLRLLLSASEPLLSDIPRTWMSEFKHPARHVHMFGQTETAGIVALYHVPESLEGNVSVLPIGNPIANTEIYILDADLHPCAVGVAGELYIGGAGVGRGYLKRPDLTAQKFISHLFSQEAGVRLYRTGDWARRRADGQIECVGRSDQQVKLRGFRVELGEIETALARHPSIRESAVVARGDGPDKRLIAYFVGAGIKANVAELRSFLSVQLPDYAVPALFVQMNALPLSANGKVNRLALPEPDDARAALSTEFVAPQTEIEKRLAAIWCDVLRLETVGRDDNFFELGGHSLLAAQVVARLRNELKLETPFRLIFGCPTVALMAVGIGSTTAEDLLPRTLEPFERDAAAPLSFNQQQFWLLEQSGPTPSAYNVRTAIQITGRLDVEKLQQALATTVGRHEILRTSIAVQGDSAMQVIAAAVPTTLQCSDLSHLPEAERETEIVRALTHEATQPFDLSEAPLLRTRLLKQNEAEHVLLMTLPHLVCDGWSVGVLLRELTTLYQAAIDNQRADLPHLPVQYADFALWQRRWLQDDTLARQLSYWKHQLADAPSVLDLPGDYSRPAVRSFDGAKLSVRFPELLSRAIKQLGQSEDATLFMTLLAAFQTFLFRYSGQEDIVIGSPVAGRTMLETENLIGAFVNTLVFRGDLAGNPTFHEFLAQVRETTLGALSHQDLPFERLVEELKPERRTNRSPLFQVMFALQNAPAPEIAVAGLVLTPIALDSAKSKFDLSLEVTEQGDELLVSFEYSTDLFAPATVERMLGHFQNLLEQVVADPSKRLREFPLLGQTEQHQLLVEWNSKRLEVPQHACIHELFEAQAGRTPEAIAAEFRGERITYRELNARANQLARYLRKQDVGPDVLVGLSIERSLEMLVSMLGILKAGGAYVPLDPTYPQDRIAFMIEDTCLSLVLTRQHLIGNIPGNSRCVSLDEDWESIANESVENPAVNVTAKNLAYVIYTSGSSGIPKGTMVEHRSLVNFTLAATSAYEISPADRVLQFGSLSFDLSVEEIYPALTVGASVILRTDEMIGSARDFLQYCEKWQLTVLDLPTAYWHELTDALGKENLSMSPRVRLVIIGGEKASADRLIGWKRLVGESVRLVNTYGPTETTVAVTVCDLGKDENLASNAIAIGRPMANTSLYVLDKWRQPVPIGIAGELYVGGAGVARGYLNRPDLTAESFISNPFCDEPGARLYKTGDVVRYRADGHIEYLHRLDNQIKIRGFRVELEEIEQAIRSHEGVNDCVVIFSEADDRRLVAYVVTGKHSDLSVASLRNFLKAKLPSYMVPGAFALIDTLPLMPNGKIDRQALPEPQLQLEADDSFVAPSSPFEELLASAWREVLGIERIGIHDNFFDIGGHSLLATRVVSNVRTMMDVPFGMVDVFQSPTIAGLAALLYPRAAQKESEADLAKLLAEIANLSDEEAQQCLAQELQSAGI